MNGYRCHACLTEPHNSFTEMCRWNVDLKYQKTAVLWKESEGRGRRHTHLKLSGKRVGVVKFCHVLHELFNQQGCEFTCRTERDHRVTTKIAAKAFDCYLNRIMGCRKSRKYSRIKDNVKRCVRDQIELMCRWQRWWNVKLLHCGFLRGHHYLKLFNNPNVYYL